MRNESVSPVEVIDNYLKEGQEELAHRLLIDSIIMRFLKWPDIEKYIKEDGSTRFSMGNKIAILEKCIECGLLEIPVCKSTINLPKDMTIGLEIESAGPKAGILQKCDIGDWTPKEDKTVWGDVPFHEGVEYIHPKFYRR